MRAPRRDFNAPAHIYPDYFETGCSSQKRAPLPGPRPCIVGLDRGSGLQEKLMFGVVIDIDEDVAAAVGAGDGVDEVLM